MTAAWNGVGMPSLRSSTYGWQANLTTPRQPGGQTGGFLICQTALQLRIGRKQGVSMSNPVVLHPAPFSTSARGSELTAYLSVELRRRRYRISALNPDYDGEDEEEDRDGEDDMEDEDSETTSLEYRTFNYRAGGWLGSKYDTQQIGDAEPANAASRDGELNAGQVRVTAMNQRKTTLAANTGLGSDITIWGSNTGERRWPANPPGPANKFHNMLPNRLVEQFKIP